MPKDDDPFSNWYEAYLGFIIRANTESHAREIVSNLDTNIRPIAWLDEKYSVCEIITPDGDAGVIMADYQGQTKELDY